MTWLHIGMSVRSFSKQRNEPGLACGNLPLRASVAPRRTGVIIVASNPNLSRLAMMGAKGWRAIRVVSRGSEVEGAIASPRFG
jgi:hypothetical protein